MVLIGTHNRNQSYQEAAAEPPEVIHFLNH
jgi:hypothetical protein